MGFNNNDFPESESYYAEAISLPIFPILNKTDQEYIIETLEYALL
jgi:dTDP-4-amino-4,6-dideoxygalactose transaminase